MKRIAAIPALLLALLAGACDPCPSDDGSTGVVAPASDASTGLEDQLDVPMNENGDPPNLCCLQACIDEPAIAQSTAAPCACEEQANPDEITRCEYLLCADVCAAPTFAGLFPDDC